MHDGIQGIGGIVLTGQQDGGEQVPGFDQIGSHGHGPAGEAFSLVQPTAILKGDAAIDQGIDIVRIDGQGLAVVDLGLVQPAEILVDVAQIIAGLGVVRPDGQRPQITDDGLLGATERFQDTAQIAMSHGRTGSQAHGLAKVGQGFVQPVKLHQGYAAIVIEVRRFGGKHDGPVQTGQGLLGVPLLQADRTENVPTENVLRIALGHASRPFLDIRQATGPIQLHDSRKLRLPHDIGTEGLFLLNVHGDILCKKRVRDVPVRSHFSTKGGPGLASLVTEMSRETK